MKEFGHVAAMSVDGVGRVVPDRRSGSPRPATGPPPKRKAHNRPRTVDCCGQMVNDALREPDEKTRGMITPAP
jgi:hypothetical protein